jgi:hypothetical protein
MRSPDILESIIAITLRWIGLVVTSSHLITHARFFVVIIPLASEETTEGRRTSFLTRSNLEGNPAFLDPGMRFGHSLKPAWLPSLVIGKHQVHPL